MIVVVSLHEMALSKAEQRRIWKAFIERGTSHSGKASTLPFVMRKCELEGVEYRLTAMPGESYWIEPMAVVRKAELVSALRAAGCGS